MFIYVFKATFIILAEFNHIIKVEIVEALYNITVLFKQFA